MRIEIRQEYDVWYVVQIFGVKTCFKISVKKSSTCYDRQKAIEMVKSKVKRETGHEVISCTTVDPFDNKTRAWKNEIIANRTYEELPPHAY